MAVKNESGGWRYLALLMTAFQVLTLALLIYLWWGYSGNLKAVSEAADICVRRDSEAMDSIRAAQMFGRLDVLTLMFGVIAATLGVAALLGTRVFRREVLAEARETAASLIPDEVRRVVAENYATQPRGAGSGNLFTPEDVPYDRVPSENGTDAATGSAPDYTGASDEGAGASRDDSSRSWYRRIREWLLGR